MSAASLQPCGAPVQPRRHLRWLPAQPPSIREKRSRMTARYNQPSAGSTALVSLTHLLVGCSAVNSRLR